MPTTACFQLALDMGHGLAHPLAQIAALIAIAQFQGLAGTGGGARGNGGAANGTIGGDDIGLDGGIAARIQNFPGTDVDDLGHDATPRGDHPQNLKKSGLAAVA
jgi:hypothetical protein